MSFVVGLAIGTGLGFAIAIVVMGIALSALGRAGIEIIGEAIDAANGVDVSHSDDCMTVIDEALLCDCQGATS